MKRLLGTFALAAVIAAAGAGGYRLGRQPASPPWLAALLDGGGIVPASGAVPEGPIVYYRHPDGDPAYSATPRKTGDGRDFVAVRASEDISFDAPASAETMAADQAVPRDRRILYYRNPMGLPDTSPVPKKDSMGMDYIPVYEGEETEAGIVRVPAGKLQRTGVRTTLATRARIVRPVRVPGTVMLDERRISIVSTRTEAFVEEVSGITTGAAVARGEPLVRFYAREIASAGALYAADLKSGSRAGAAGSLQRLQNLGVPAGAVAEIEKTGRVPLAVTLTAPRDGIVLERAAVNGMMAGPGDTLFRIADISTMWVVADVPEYQLGAIRKGAPATIRVRSLPGREFTGTVELVYPELQGETRTARVRIELANPEGLLFANMYAEVEIATGSRDAAVTVPDSAVIDTGDRRVVIVDKGEGRFEPRDVTLGTRGDGMVEIADGVAEGDRVVVSANFLIDAESNLKAALGAFAPAEMQP